MKYTDFKWLKCLEKKLLYCWQHRRFDTFYTEFFQEGPNVNRYAAATLHNFCVWQQSQNVLDDSHPSHHDTALLITRCVSFLSFQRFPMMSVYILQTTETCPYMVMEMCLFKTALSRLLIIILAYPFMEVFNYKKKVIVIKICAIVFAISYLDRISERILKSNLWELLIFAASASQLDNMN